ncbi:MAG: ribonuclease R [Ignavibacteria bacterium]
MRKSKIKQQIEKLLENSPTRGYKSKEISKKLNIKTDEDYTTLKQILSELYRQGKLIKRGKRYLLARDANQIIGILRMTKNGYGFVTPEPDDGEDIFISERNLNTALNGDKVVVEIFARYRGKNPEGEIIKVLERSTEEFVGKLEAYRGLYFVIPDDNLIHRDFFVHEESLNGAKNGDKVVVRLVEWPTPKVNPVGEVIEILGKPLDHTTEMISIAKSFKIRTKFPEEVLEEANQFSEETIRKEIPNRLDLRDKIVFTIDPADAKDFDDALSIETIDKNRFLVGVHIADVSFFVKENSALDLEARKRGTSVYLVNYVVPMLPEALSNKWCSLVPGEDRLCFSVFIEMNKKAEVLNYRIEETVINNKRRFTYDEVEEILKSGKGDFAEELLQLNEIAKILFRKRIQSGGIDFTTDEVRFILGSDGVPIEVKKKEHLQSYKLIEDFMLLANKIIAKEGKKYEDTKKVPFIYRVHDVPDDEKIRQLASFVNSLGYRLNIAGGVKSKSLQKLLEQVKGKPEEVLVNEVMIRAMAKAEYSEKNIGHYGLAFQHYTHFTSPIRRYPDLVVHRLIKEYKNEISSKRANELRKIIPDICKTSSVAERIAMEAEREAIKFKQVQFMKNKIGEEFEGIISGVQVFGIFVEIIENLAEGLVRLKNMPGDIYFYDENKYALIGRLNKQIYRLGDLVKVKVINVSEERNEIDFALVE